MLDAPARFTDAQRELFWRVARLIRSRPADFVDAGTWLDACSGTTELSPAPGRRRARWREQARARRELGRHHLVPDDGVTLRASRVILARRIRRELAGTAARPLSHFGIIERAVAQLASEPPDLDAMKPELARRDARRVLLVVWILTDTDELWTSPRVTKLQDWDWGEHALEFLKDLPDGDEGPIPRLYARRTLLDRNRERWEVLTRDALRVIHELDQAGAATADQPSDPPAELRQGVPVTPPAQDPRSLEATRRTDGHFSPAELELAISFGVDPEAARKALQRWRENHAGGDGYVENPDRRPNEPRFLYSRRAVAAVMERLKDRATRRDIRRAKTSGQRPPR